MHCPDEAAACLQRLEEIRATDPSRYSSIMFLAGVAAATAFAPAAIPMEADA